MPGLGGNWRSKPEKRRTKKFLRDFNQCAKRSLEFSERKSIDSYGETVVRKGRPIESFYNSQWINKKSLNRQNRLDESSGWTRRSKEKYSKAYIAARSDLSIVEPILEDERYIYEDKTPLRKPQPRTLQSMISRKKQHERLRPVDEETDLQLAIAMSLQETPDNNVAENEALQEALLVSIRDCTPASSWQDVGGSERSVPTTTWQEVGGSELSVPVTVNSWVDVARGGGASIDEKNGEEPPHEGSRSASPGTEQSWSLIES